MIRHLQDARMTVSKKKLLLFYLGVFIASIATLVSYICIRLGFQLLCRTFGDGWLYISIADNLIDNGHFIQTVRAGLRSNMVVPFGLPLLLVPIRLVTRNYLAVTIVQYILFGLTNVLISDTSRRWFGSIGLFAPAFYTLGIMFRYESSPAIVCLTEPWYLFFLTLALWTLSHEGWSIERRITALNICAFIAVAIRPAMLVFYIPAIGAVILYTFKEKMTWKRCAVLLLAPLLILSLNVAVNYRETGTFVIFENYSSIDRYLANNPESIPGYEKYYGSLFENSIIDYKQETDKYSKLFYDYLFDYPYKFLTDTLYKFYVMFIVEWRGLIVPTIACIIYILARDRRRKLFIVIYISLFIECIITSTAMINLRYTVFIIPFCGLTLSALASDFTNYILELIHNKKMTRTAEASIILSSGDKQSDGAQ